MEKKRPAVFSVPRKDVLLFPESVLLEASSRSQNPTWRKDFSAKVMPHLKK